MRFHPSPYSYGEGWVEWYVSKAPTWTPVGYVYSRTQSTTQVTSGSDVAQQQQQQAIAEAQAAAERVRAASMALAASAGGTTTSQPPTSLVGQPPSSGGATNWLPIAVIGVGVVAAGAILYMNRKA